MNFQKVLASRKGLVEYDRQQKEVAAMAAATTVQYGTSTVATASPDVTVARMSTDEIKAKQR